MTSDRNRLPARRPSVSFAFEWAPDPKAWRRTRFVGTLGFDRAMRPMELFLHCEKTTSLLEAVGRDAAILVSLLLQRGGNFDEMREAMTREEDGRAASLVGEVLDQVERVTAEQVAELMR